MDTPLGSVSVIVTVPAATVRAGVQIGGWPAAAVGTAAGCPSDGVGETLNVNGVPASTGLVADDTLHISMTPVVWAFAADGLNAITAASAKRPAKVGLPLGNLIMFFLRKAVTVLLNRRSRSTNGP